MQTRPLLNEIARDEALVRGLGDEEARLLVFWLVEQAERLLMNEPDPGQPLRRLRQRGRAISRFVTLWCYHHAHGAAGQLAATERFTWPLPEGPTSAEELMATILHWEEEHSSC